MLMIRTVCVSLLRWSNQLSRLYFSAPSFSGGRNFRLLQFQRMDSFGNSASGRLLPDATFYGTTSSGGDEEYSQYRDDDSDLIMVGSIPVSLKRRGRERNSSLSSSVKRDNFELGGVQKGSPSNIPSSDHEDEFSPLSKLDSKKSKTILSCAGSLKNNNGRSTLNNRSSSQLESYSMLKETSRLDKSSLPDKLDKKNERFYVEKLKCQSGDIGFKKDVVMNNLPPSQPFDICQFAKRDRAKSECNWRLKGSDALKIEERVAEAMNNRVLRPGMVLLKHYIAPVGQVNIVKTCRKLGLGPGGFYRPGYKDGAKLRLQMMCLGLDWDPQTRKYVDKRAVDGNKPPDIPPEFAMLVKKTLKEAHALIRNESSSSNIEGLLPSMSPDICIVNFYMTSGRLGLHQDRDESKQSLLRGLPVVSFSIGDSAEFLYGDQRDVDKAEKVVLESGDVLIFGGESRHIYHGLSSIIPNSAPKFLLDSHLRPGRLNLTFREY